MGCGSWKSDDFVSYSVTKGLDVSDDGKIRGLYSNQDMFKAVTLDHALDPKNVIRECCDSAEHPNTLPVILALDVTGSMGDAAVEVSKTLNEVMTKLYEKIADVEFMIMGIGDLAYDRYPIQASQFESDIRIAEQLDKLYFEFGGGGNRFESYTAAWHFGLHHTKLDCLNRNRKGIIITMGDEMLNPYLPLEGLRCSMKSITGDSLQADVETRDLYKETSEKFNLYHLNVEHGGYNYRQESIENSFKEYMDDKHFRNVNMNNIADAIVDIIVGEVENNETNTNVMISTSGEIVW